MYKDNICLVIPCNVSLYVFNLLNLLLRDRLRRWIEQEHLHFFACKQKHGKIQRVPSLVYGTCRSKKGELGELVVHAQVWWPYIVAHLDRTFIFKL